MIANNAALILVDLQNDFCAGGSLAVPLGDEVIAVANRIQTLFQEVVATKDWHPENHGSFYQNHPNKNINDVIQLGGIEQILWPAHCVQDTPGADFYPELALQNITKIFYKGTDEAIDSYSAFFDNQQLRATGLYDYLQSHAIDTIYIMGLATEYCVKYTCLDAMHLGLHTYLITDGCRGINLAATDVADTYRLLKAHGVRLTTAEALLAHATIA